MGMSLLNKTRIKAGQYLGHLSTAVVFSCLASTQAVANDLFLDLNQDSIFARFDGTHARNGLNLTASALFNDENGDVLSLGLFTNGQLNRNSSFNAGLGAKLMYLNLDGGDDVQALAVGGSLFYTLPRSSDVKIGAELYYAPSITVTDDLDGVLDLNIRLSYQAFDNGAIYAGFRLVELDFDGGEFELEEGLHLGFKLSI